MGLNRRDFLAASLLSAWAAATPLACEPVKVVNEMPYRTLGKTGESVSLLGVGGYHIGVEDLSDDESIALMRHAVDEGVNFFDNAWDYLGGRSERLMGRALKDGYRDKVFLMTKVLDRTKEGAQRQLDESLQRMDVDVIDLWQIHSIQSPDDANAAYSEGVLEVAQKAREEGKIRYIGFTGHVQPEGHLEMIARGFDWATVQMPLNIHDHHFHSFAQQVIPKARDNGMGVIAMKTLAGNAEILGVNKLTVEEALRYSMGLPISVVVSGMDSRKRLDENIRIAKNFKPFEEAELKALLARIEPAAINGEYEYFKTPAETA